MVQENGRSILWSANVDALTESMDGDVIRQRFFVGVIDHSAPVPFSRKMIACTASIDELPALLCSSYSLIL